MILLLFYVLLGRKLFFVWLIFSNCHFSFTLTFNSRYLFVEKNVYFCDNENKPLGTETIHDVFKQNKTMSRDTGL